jgi:hypothetical protein
MINKNHLSYLTAAMVIAVVFTVGSEQVAAQTGLADVCSGADCSTCHVVDLANRLIQWLIGIITVLFAVLACVAGFKLVTSGGNQQALSSAKDMLVNAVVGFILVLAAYLIVDTIVRTLVGSDQISGAGPWSQVQCFEQTELDDLPSEVAEMDNSDRIAATAVNPFAVQVAGVSGVDATGFPTCEPSDPSFPDCGSRIVVNDQMNPIFDPANGGSSLVRPGAAARMQETLNGPFAQLQRSFGRDLVINDAIAKAGTSREANTPNSRHFFGDAIDVSLAGMSNADRLRLVREARAAGFTGFGLGNNILHIDRRPTAPQAWNYENSTYGGVSSAQLEAELEGR